MILIIDNYDSFTFNLVQLVGAIRPADAIRVVRNDAATADALDALDASHIIVSPGPGTPDDAGVSMALIERLAGRVPILGVCLGHQCIAQLYGGRVTQANRLMHGKTSVVHHDGLGIFADVPNPFSAMRYHSLIVQTDSLPPELEVSAWTDENEPMALRHKSLPLDGVQFHPESFLTQAGEPLMRAFLLTEARAATPAV